MNKNPLWKQKNPFDQLTVLLMALEGDVDNLGEFITIERMKERSNQIFPQLHDLKYFLQNPEKW